MVEFLIVAYVIGGLLMLGFYLRNTWGEWVYGPFGWVLFGLAMFFIWPFVVALMLFTVIDERLDRRKMIKAGWREAKDGQGRTYLEPPEDIHG